MILEITFPKPKPNQISLLSHTQKGDYLLTHSTLSVFSVKYVGEDVMYVESVDSKTINLNEIQHITHLVMEDVVLNGEIIEDTEGLLDTLSKQYETNDNMLFEM